MMKKNIIYIIAISAAAALMLTACGNSTDNVVTEAQTTMAEPAEETTAPLFTEGAAEAETESGEQEGQFEKTFDASEKYIDYETLFAQGEVTAFEKNIITINSEEEGSMTFDISGADLDEDNLIYHGCFVEVEYPDLPEKQKVTEAITVLVLMTTEEYASETHRDPSVWGRLQVADINELQITDRYGNECYFDNGLARTVSFSDLKVGDMVYVTYMGTLDKAAQKSDEDGSGAGIPYSLKVVSEDAINSEEAKNNYMSGIVNTINGKELLLDTEILSFKFTAEDENVLRDYAENDYVKVYYEGSLRDKVVRITKIERDE